VLSPGTRGSAVRNSPDRNSATWNPRERGSASLELAFVAPVLLLVVFVGVQAGLWAYGRSVALQSAREGVSQLRLLSDAQSVEAARPLVSAHVVQFATALGRESLLRPAVTSRSFVDATGEPRVEVTVSGSVISLVPGLHLSTTQRATGAVEHFGADR